MVEKISPTALITIKLESVTLAISAPLGEATEHLTLDELLTEIESLSSKADIADFLGREFCMEHFNLREDNRS